jgi:ribosomal protein L37AE/L43A
MNDLPNRAFSRTDLLVCPSCEAGELRLPNMAHPTCDSCSVTVSQSEFATLRQIVALPEAIGAHACECGHPEMRLLPDGVYLCPACGAEVLPFRPHE